MSLNRLYNVNKAKKGEILQLDNVKKGGYDCEENATSQLIQISNEFDIAELTHVQNYNDFSKQRYANYSPEKDVKLQLNSFSRKKLNIDFFIRSQRNWQRKNPHYLSGEQVCVMKKDKILNLSSFLIIQNDNLANLSISPSKTKIQPEGDHAKINYRVKNSKNLINFIRKRNINFNQQSLQNSREQTKSPHKMPEVRLNMSCELKRQKESPVRYLINNEQDSVFRSTSPNVKNQRRISNYIKFRMSKVK